MNLWPIYFYVLIKIALRCAFKARSTSWDEDRWQSWISLLAILTLLYRTMATNKGSQVVWLPQISGMQLLLMAPVNSHHVDMLTMCNSYFSALVPICIQLNVYAASCHVGDEFNSYYDIDTLCCDSICHSPLTDVPHMNMNNVDNISYHGVKSFCTCKIISPMTFFVWRPFLHGTANNACLEVSKKRERNE